MRHELYFPIFSFCIVLTILILALIESARKRKEQRREMVYSLAALGEKIRTQEGFVKYIKAKLQDNDTERTEAELKKILQEKEKELETMYEERAKLYNVFIN